MNTVMIKIDPKELASVRELLSKLNGEEVSKAQQRCINTTMVGVRTDGVKILTDQYALTASAIRNTWKISKASFRDSAGSTKNSYGVVSSTGMFIRLKEFGAQQTKTGVSVKVLKKNPRAVIRGAFFATLGYKQGEQVYWRVYHNPQKQPVKNRGYYANLPLFYRFPVKALYGPRIQDYLGDPGIIDMLTKSAGERLEKNMAHEVDRILQGY
jgi:hypothetical protein